MLHSDVIHIFNVENFEEYKRLLHIILIDRIDTQVNSIIIAVIFDVNVDSDIEVEYEDTKKKYTGTYTANGSKSKLFR